MRKKTIKLAVIVSASVWLGVLGIPAATYASGVQPAAEAILNTPEASDSHDELTLKGKAQFDGNYIKLNLSREGTLYSGNFAGITLNAKGKPYIAEGTIVDIDAKITQPGGIELMFPRWSKDGDINKAVVVLPIGWLNEEQKAGLAAASEISVNVKLQGVQEPYVLKLPFKQEGVVRNIQPPAPKADSQFQIGTTRIAAGEGSVRIELAVKGVPEQAHHIGYDIYDNLGNELDMIARDSKPYTRDTIKDTIFEDLLYGAVRPDAEFLIIRPYQAVFEKGNQGLYKLDAKGNVIKNYYKQLEIKIPLK
ncbi:hypothetical protein SAMN05216191_102271 [Paenibacillus jilunlii]|uniref:DUF5643 domain-containing protein n=1 Tax=Paenibacillus jilunlii TaxID=682956 RepID=A0A1G9J0F5_9BACL|nr:hypothetical protein AML91_05195 [Paenibacillus jilunlii]SDL30801.1 hypothetical protein SAMN05216191_102271 [Paenibacillus jilunlii]